MMSFEEQAQFQEVTTAAEAGRLKEALAYANRRLEKDPLDLDGLCLGSYALRRLGMGVPAYHYALAAVREVPNNAALWLNLGGAAQLLWLPEVAQNAYEQAIRYASDPKHQACVWLNLSALHIDNGDFDEGERCVRECLKLSPGGRKSATANLGICQLARRQWREGWQNYREVVGGDWCPKIVYRDEPQWSGKAGQRVVIYEDQGLGDAISFASVLPDALKDAQVILDCDARLAKLFQRSFPSAKVYGTRRQSASCGKTWDKADRVFDASLPLSQLGQFYRNRESDFPGTPYLIPCPIRTAMWRERFAALGKPVIGLAWSGGVAHTNARYRQLTLKQLRPLLESVDAHWVCLQYQDAAAELAAFRAECPQIDLVQYPWATLTQDYDDTAALIAALDQVICMQTAVAHTAGALGVPVTVLLPRATTWRYGHGERIPWYHSLRIVRQSTHGQWDDEIADLARIQAAAGAAARERQLRGDGRGVRRAHQRPHRANGGQTPP